MYIPCLTIVGLNLNWGHKYQVCMCIYKLELEITENSDGKPGHEWEEGGRYYNRVAGRDVYRKCYYSPTFEANAMMLATQNCGQNFIALHSLQGTISLK